MKICTLAGLAFLLLAVGATPGCGKTERMETKTPTQVAAKVNAEEITVHQVNNILARTPNVAPETAGDVKREILNRLIEQQLARQEAINSQLDRSPSVMQAMEAARSEILARAHLERIAASLPRPTEEEVRKYYAEHPELFSRRRVYSLEEILIGPQADLAAPLREQVARAQTMRDVASWLETRAVKFTVNSGVRAAEQIPLEMLSKLQDMKDGDIRLFQADDGRADVIRIAASKPAPVDEATAAPRIQQFLFNRRSSEAVAKEIKRLKDKATIAYVGEFADGAAASEAKARADGETKARALSERKAREKADAQARAEVLRKERAAGEAKARIEAEDRADELARARRAGDTKARLEADAAARDVKSNQPPIPQEAIDKGIRGLK